MVIEQVYVGIGSNRMRKYNLRAALVALQHRFGTLVVSSVYESVAVNFTGAKFYNMVIGFTTELEPAALLRELHAIEKRHGRSRGGQRHGSRTLDLDLLLYGDRARGRPPCLPHPDLLTRSFALRPLAEIAGDQVHPLNGSCIGALWGGFQGGPALRPVRL